MCRVRPLQATAGAVKHRFEAGLCFVLGESWLKERVFSRNAEPEAGSFPPWLDRAYPAILSGALLAMLLLALTGWRWAFAWQPDAMPSSLALIWIPLPYFLSHAELLSGPRLPLDGVLLTYAALALACLFVPGWYKVAPETKEGAEEKAA